MSSFIVSVATATLLREDPRPGRQGRTWLESALESIASQDLSEWVGWNLEASIGLDANAPDPGPGLLERAGSLAPRLVVRWSRAERPGRAAAANAAVAAATGDLLAMLDDDDWWETPWLARAVPLIGRHHLVSASQSLVDLGGNVAGIFDFPVPSTWIMERHLWVELGGMDESFWCHADTDFLGRVNASGKKRIHLVPAGRPVQGNPILERVAHHSSIQATVETRPMVLRSVNPSGITETIRRREEALARSGEAEELMVRRYGELPW